ncbi:helix-turn-helix domain-containing protein [Bacillus songklensis]|uniref:Helix-turn-helix domain-containing protein n=1 Tax=Bacillus songklensis TaxID=1069116 RepID=A0ABV8B405_9BACI
MEQQVRIGSIIRELRKMVGLSQKELAQGICTQAQISKLENGDEYPYSITLYEISKRLGVDMNYFFDIIETPRLDYVAEVKNLIRQYIRKRDYDSVAHIVQREKESPLFQTPANKQFLMWHEGICDYYVYKNKDKSLSKLYEAITLTQTSHSYYKEREIEVLNSVAIIHNEEKEFGRAVDIYKTALTQLKYLPQIKNEKIKIRILYGLSRTLTEMGEYKESLVYSERGIHLCISCESLYLFGELHYQSGCNLIKMQQKEKGTQYLEKAIFIFGLEKNEKFVALVKQQMKKLLEQHAI